MTGADAYLPLMAEHHVIVDRAARRATIAAQVAALAAEVGGEIPDDPALLDEVTDLVEQPTALRGSFSSDYLRLPKEVLITVMKKHQRYFPVVAGGAMLPYFITVRNGPAEFIDSVREGNEGVIRALCRRGVLLPRTRRGPWPSSPPVGHADLPAEARLDARQGAPRRAPDARSRGEPGADGRGTGDRPAAAALFKSDLATQMVVELTSLQGVMGREYARLSGEPEAVADAIYEHYLPRFQGDAAPASKPGLLLGIANRLDSLVGLFAVNLAPTSTTDPFGLRRGALGLVGALIGRQQSFDLRAGPGGSGRADARRGVAAGAGRRAPVHPRPAVRLAARAGVGARRGRCGARGAEPRSVSRGEGAIDRSWPR